MVRTQHPKKFCEGTRKWGGTRSGDSGDGAGNLGGPELAADHNQKESEGEGRQERCGSTNYGCTKRTKGESETESKTRGKKGEPRKRGGKLA